MLDVLDVISLVPPSAAPLALRACCPSIDSVSSLQLSCAHVERCHLFRKAVDVDAAATLTHLQHLSIGFPMRRDWDVFNRGYKDQLDGVSKRYGCGRS